MNLPQVFTSLASGVITTIAGVGYRDGIPAREADAGWPMGVVRRCDGDLIVVDYWGNRIWRIDPEGILHRFAGTGIPGRCGDGGSALEARLLYPHDLCQDNHGNLYFSDLGNATIRRIDRETGVITRVAGCGRTGRGGDGGPAVEAELDCTCGVAVDRSGNIFLASEWMNNIRRIDAKTGTIETFAGQSARHYPSERGSSRPFAGPGLSLGGYHGDGGPAQEAGFYHPEHLAFDSKGNLYICDNSNDRIRMIDMSTGIVTTVLGNGQRASNGDGGPAVEASTLMPDAICLDAHDNLYVGEKYGFRVRTVNSTSGIVTTLVGNGVPGFGEEGLHGSETQCNSCEAGIWADPDGTVYWGDCSGRLRRCDGRTGIVTTALGGTSVHDGAVATNAFLCGPGGMSVGPDGDIYIADTWNQRVRAIGRRDGLMRHVAGTGARAYGGDNGPATEAHLGNPADVSVDARGRVVIADSRHCHIRRVDEDGVIRVVAGNGLPWDKGDGGPAISACVVKLMSVTHGPNDDIYLGDAIGRIRKIDASDGIIRTVAGCGLPGYTGDGGPAERAKIGSPTAIDFDAGGNLYFADCDHHVIRKVDRRGVITTIAGTGKTGFSPDGTGARAAMIASPWGLAVASDGLIHFSDSANNRVRRIRPDGTLQTIAGGGVPGDAGDGSSATSARLNEPHGICFYGEHILLISDFYNNRIKAVAI